jgi:tetratricopeptide (TPR) repeat protein
MYRLVAAVSLERWPEALETGKALEALQASAVLGQIGSQVGVNAQAKRMGVAYSAYAKARTGDLAGAEATIAATPLDCDTCVRMRGRIAAAKGDFAGAEGWFARTIRQAPSLPFAYADWGAMLLARGDVDGSIAKLEVAHAKGPRYADALEQWGEALMKKGDYAGAASKFAEAAKYSPHWERNRQQWRSALAKVQAHG